MLTTLIAFTEDVARLARSGVKVARAVRAIIEGFRAGADPPAGLVRRLVPTALWVTGIATLLTLVR